MKTVEKNLILFDYIMNAINTDGYDVEAETPQAKLQFLWDCFDSEYNYEANKRRYPNLQERISEWLMGLPSCIDIAFYNWDILSLAKEWQMIPSDATEKVEDKLLENWWSLIARKILILLRRHSILLD